MGLVRRTLLAVLLSVVVVYGLDLALPWHVTDGVWAMLSQVAPHAATHPALPQASAPVARRHVRGAPRPHHLSPPQKHARPQRPAADHVAARRRQPALTTTIVIPRLGIVAPVREGTVDVTGTLPIVDGYAVTRFPYSPDLGQRGNYVVYGHDDIQGNIFQYLGSLQPGDRVYLRRGGQQFVYVVTGSQIVDPTDVSVLDPTPNATLTMISCTPYWVDTQRIVVRAKLVSR